METNTWLSCFILTLGTNFVIQINGRLNFFIKRLEICNPNYDYPLKANVTFRTVDGKQYADGIATFKTALDDNLRANLTVDLLVGRKYMQVIKLEERRACTSMHRYFGEFAYDIERHAQLVPGLCPIPPGRYYVYNYPLNFHMMTLQNLPFGNMLVKDIATDKNNKVMMCLIAEVANKA